MSDRSEKEIFHAALELTDAARRGELLDSACQGDLTLRRQVEELLAAHEDELLQAPAVAPAQFSAAGPDIGTDEQIGHYKLLERIGEGGFGVVYMADQLEPIQRRVALKIIKQGMGSRQVIARFEAERQALSLMNHPNIALVLDAGTTEAGRPYFVMELVRGVPVTEYCEEARLSTEERLRLFVDICSALQHAHQKGIIHRDVKPSNVLVTTDGDRPVPKVIDFGVAKATQGQLTDKTLFTQFRQFIGTPAYMSPEQARMSAHDVDTRADIYSLGVLLYELLTDKTPLDTKQLESDTLDDICRRIREEQPPKPSTRLSTMTLAERSRIAERRKSGPDELGQLIRGELDWIVMKAIEKDRARRYETAEGFAADVRRYLNNEPVEAGPPSSIYRLTKYVSRHRVAVLTAVVVAVALVVGTVASSVGFVRARHEQRNAEDSQAELAQQLVETDEARQEAELNLYISDMNRAATECDAGNLALALSLLSKHEAAFGDRFEWRYIRQWCQGDALHTFHGHTSPVKSVAVSKQGVIASGSTDGIFRLIDVKAKKEIERRQLSSGIIRVDFTADGQVLAVAEENNRITIWRVDPLEQLGAFQEGPEFSDIEFLPDGMTLAVAPFEPWHSLRLWNRQSQNVVSVLPAEVKGRFVSISPTGQFLSLVGPTPQVSLAQVTSDGTYRRYAEMPLAHDWHLRDSAFSPQENYLATTDGSQIRMWNLDELHQAEIAGVSPKPVSILRGKRTSHETRALSYSPDGRYFASGGKRGTISLWRGRPPWRPEESELVTWRGHKAAVTSIAFSHDGTFIVSGSEDHTVKLWPGDAGYIPTDVAMAEDWIFAVAFSPDNTLLATGGFDGRVRLFDTQTMEKVYDKKLHDNQVMGVAVSPNGRWLVSCEGGWRFANGVNYATPGRGVSVMDLKNRAEQYYFEMPVSVLGRRTLRRSFSLAEACRSPGWQRVVDTGILHKGGDLPAVFLCLAKEARGGQAKWPTDSEAGAPYGQAWQWA